VLLLDEPTQGVDVGAKAAIYELIAAAAREGTGVVISSSDPEELVMLCDRVLVMQGGRVAADVPREELTEARLVREELALDGGPASAREEIPHD
jgi:ribose transport system ATP-binding protein